MAKARSLVRTTLIPDAAAERSLARTASMADPIPLVRILATTSPTATSVTSTRKQNGSRGKAEPVPTRRFNPKSVGPLIGLAKLLLTKSVLRNQKAPRPRTARARVTTARGRPRIRARREPDHDTDRRRTKRGQKRCDRERNPPTDGQRAEEERGHTGQYQLGQ